jgi:hypothetical protein
MELEKMRADEKGWERASSPSPLLPRILPRRRGQTAMSREFSGFEARI